MESQNDQLGQADRSSDFSRNSFDLIRLVAAAQVATTHSVGHLQGGSVLSRAAELWDTLPGVPVFFFISGFLISRSCERAPTMKDYFLNRFLRIYPALWACFALSLAAALVCGVKLPGFSALVAWVGAQTTFFQFYNPEFLRGFGVGVINGSLWTISVELQFYVFVPLLHRLISGRSARTWWAVVGVLSLLSIWTHQLLGSHDVLAGTLAGKLLSVSLLPWLHMFLVGVLAQRYFPKLRAFIEGRRTSIVVASGALIVTLSLSGLGGRGNFINLLGYLPLCALVFVCAYETSGVGGRIFHGNDISYGVYIYHMPVVNVLHQLGWFGSTFVMLALGATFALATSSWIFIERPALRRKRHALRDRNSAVAQNS